MVKFLPLKALLDALRGHSILEATFDKLQSINYLIFLFGLCKYIKYKGIRDLSFPRFICLTSIIPTPFSVNSDINSSGSIEEGSPLITNLRVLISSILRFK